MPAARGSTPGSFRAPRRTTRRAGGAGSRGEARRQAILRAAFDLCLERGYGGVTMGDIVGRAGGSLTTLYELFGSKERLFEAILVDFASDLAAPLDDEALGDQPMAAMEKTLPRVAERFLTKILEPRALAWFRMATAEAVKYPELRASFLRAGKGTLRGKLAAYLAAQTRAGRLRAGDAELAAAQFLELVKAPLHLRALLGDLDSVPRGAVARQARAAVRTFLHGYGLN
jgi:TetR/AcrR family transcriptional repressor of cmeABC operon